MYSDISTRIRALASANRKRASARASSVLPTPVGPQKMNEPIGRLGSFKPARLRRMAREIDRKSTRLNSSHGYISYAVFCLKKKKQNHDAANASKLDHTT